MYETIAHNNTNELVKILAPYRQWVCYRRADKVPVNPRTSYAASSTNPNDWTDYETANAAATANPSFGLGFVLTDNDPFTVIDLDDPTDPKKGFTPEQIQHIHALHQRIAPQFDSYSEVSPSGKGLHIWIKGRVPTAKKRSDKCVELYSTARYMTVTGRAYNNIPISEANGNLTQLWEEMGGGKQALPTVLWNQPQTIADDWVIERCLRVSTAAQFKTLWAGDISQHNNNGSSADLALMNLIAFHTDNKEQCIRIFRKSVLAQRLKDGKVKSNRDDYMKWTVDKAFDQKLRQPFDPATLIVPKGNVAIQNIPLTPITNDIEVVSMSAIQAKPIDWLWNGYLPKGMLALLAGAGGTGKSTMAFYFAAVISRGGIWPDGTRCARAGHTLIWTAEDSPEHSIVPRLMAMGADLDKILLVKATVGNNGQYVPFNPAKDVPSLKQKVLANGGIDLFIVDPITSAVAGDMHKANEVRQGLQAIVDFAAECNCAVIGITHFAKGTTGRNPAERVIGSVAFGAFARIVLVAAKDEETENRVLVVAKSNISNDTGGFYYAIQTRPLPNGITATCIDWGGAIEGSSREILATVEHQEGKDDNRTDIDEAKTFLVEELKKGPRYAGELSELAKTQLRISDKTLQRARKQLGIQINNEGPNKGWKWSFPTVNTSNGSAQ